MKEFFKRHNIFTRFFALLLSFCLWVFVMNVQNPTRDIQLNDVQIKLIGTQALLETHDLAVINGAEQKLSIKLKGKTADIRQLNKDAVWAEIDLSEENEAGTREFFYKISLPQNLISLQVESNKPALAELTLDKMVSKTVPVAAQASSEAPANYRYGALMPMLDEVTISGPATVLNRIISAQVIVPTEGVSQSSVIPCEYQLIDENGDAVESNYLSRAVDQINVKLTAYKIATVPLEVDLLPSEDVTADMATISIAPQTVQVYGAESMIDRLKSIKLDTIDLATEQTGAERQVIIRLPEGVRLVEGQSHYATVTLQIDGMGSRTINVSDIHLEDTSVAENPPQITMNDQNVQIMLRGKNSALTAINASDVNVTATFDSSALVLGENLVPVTVTLPVSSEDITVLSYTENITVIVENPPELPENIPQNPAEDPVEPPAENPTEAPTENPTEDATPDVEPEEFEA